MTYPATIEKQSEALATKSPTPVEQIQLSAGSDLNDGRFEIVGPVKATIDKVTALHPAPTVAQGEQKLRVEAAELGADGVINAKVSDVTICALSWGAVILPARR
ncbi:MAG: hypothetical protein VX228_00215 [Pseudomonadota bacterium]|nr:hypothetical protein [Pseudomonadota bacterium]